MGERAVRLAQPESKMLNHFIEDTTTASQHKGVEVASSAPGTLRSHGPDGPMTEPMQANVLSYGDNLDILRRYLPDAAVDLRRAVIQGDPRGH